MKKNNFLRRVMALVLVLSCLGPWLVMAAAPEEPLEPQFSDPWIMGGILKLYDLGNGTMKATARVTTSTTAMKIYLSSMRLQVSNDGVNFETVDIYYKTEHPDMMMTDVSTFTYTMILDVEPGKYYQVSAMTFVFFAQDHGDYEMLFSDVVLAT